MFKKLEETILKAIAKAIKVVNIENWWEQDFESDFYYDSKEDLLSFSKDDYETVQADWVHSRADDVMQEVLGTFGCGGTPENKLHEIFLEELYEIVKVQMFSALQELDKVVEGRKCGWKSCKFNDDGVCKQKDGGGTKYGMDPIGRMKHEQQSGEVKKHCRNCVPDLGQFRSHHININTGNGYAPGTPTSKVIEDYTGNQAIENLEFWEKKFGYQICFPSGVVICSHENGENLINVSIGREKGKVKFSVDLFIGNEYAGNSFYDTIEDAIKDFKETIVQCRNGEFGKRD